LRFKQGRIRVPTEPGLGVRIDPEALARLHDNYRNTTIRNRDDLAQMRRYDPTFSGIQPRY
jgi:glucarate dehydratase